VEGHLVPGYGTYQGLEIRSPFWGELPLTLHLQRLSILFTSAQRRGSETERVAKELRKKGKVHYVGFIPVRFSSLTN